MDDFLLEAHPKIVAKLMPRGWSRVDAEDIASEAIEKCLRMQRDHPEKTLTTGYLWTAVYNLMTDRLKHRRLVEKHRHEIEELTPRSHTDDYSGIVYREALNLLGTYLKPRVVRVLNLIVAGYDHQSITEKTGMSRYVVRNVIKDTKKKTKQREDFWRSRGYYGNRG